MRTKLTLRLDRHLIEQAKVYAAEHGTSLSRLVADYFRLLTPEGSEEARLASEEAWKDALPPVVRALVDRPAPEREVTEADYREHLVRKHG